MHSSQIFPGKREIERLFCCQGLSRIMEFCQNVQYLRDR